MEYRDIAKLSLNVSNVLDDLISLTKFSYEKNLFLYQKEAVEKAVGALALYLQDKEKMYEFYKARNEGKDFYLKVGNSAKDILLKAGFKIDKDKLSLKDIVNRASIWMATGSGKTLVIIKLIEALKALMSRGLIRKADILFLTSRDDLIDQFLKHLEEFNQGRTDRIYAYNLKEYEEVKNGGGLFSNKDDIDVFYYRSDLLSDENKEKILDYRKFPRNWYLILDEAHKGEKTDSKRQAIFTTLSKDGFLFNFSATFTDPIDHITCVYNFNLKEFISQGYGKKICLLRSDISVLTDRKGEFSQGEKQKVLLKTLILFTLIKKARKKLDFYHNPMMLVLGNSVNTEESDLELFFRELSNVALGRISKEAFDSALEELRSDISNFSYAFENGEKTLKVDNLSVEDVLIEVFNAEGFGKIEVIKIPDNSQELVFKHAVSDRPFMLLKIGDISEWLREKLKDYDITNTFLSQSVFRSLNDPEHSSVNILLGSRAFYEGWDSNRPNIILYLNIGTQDAKKFVLQSIGRGVRIEVKGERKRLMYVDPKTYNESKEDADYLETLFVFGTKIKDIQIIVDTLRTQDEDMESIADLFEINSIANQKPLIVPVYKEVKFESASAKRFEISRGDFELLKFYCSYFKPKPHILLVKHNIPIKILKLLFESLQKHNEFYNFRGKDVKDVDIVLNRVLNWFNSSNFYEFQGFENVRDKIVHFKYVRVKKDKLDSVRKIIDEAKNSKKRRVSESQLRLKIYRIHTHYYLPLIVSDDEKVDFITHIIKTPSEKYFIEELADYTAESDNFFSQFDWWMFSKIDETIDEIFIVYEEKTLKFKPDFIFWCAKGEEYYIIFIDPKSTEFADAYRKIDGYKQVFMDQGAVKSFRYEDNNVKLNVKVFLFMYGNAEDVPEDYRRFWISSLNELKSYIRIESSYCLKIADKLLSALMGCLRGSN